MKTLSDTFRGRSSESVKRILHKHVYPLGMQERKGHAVFVQIDAISSKRIAAHVEGA